MLSAMFSPIMEDEFTLFEQLFSNLARGSVALRKIRKRSQHVAPANLPAKHWPIEKHRCAIRYQYAPDLAELGTKSDALAIDGSSPLVPGEARHC